MERSSPSRTAGTVLREVKMGSETFLLSQPDRVRRAADEEAVVIARRLDMLPALAKACVGIPEEERVAWRRDYINTMVCGIASPEEWTTYYRSLWQLAFRFWNALDPKHKLTDDGKRRKTLLEGVTWAYEVVNSDDVSKEDIDSLWLGIRVVSQEDSVKNFSGSPEAGTPVMATHLTVDGPQSTPST